MPTTKEVLVAARQRLTTDWTKAGGIGCCALTAINTFVCDKALMARANQLLFNNLPPEFPIRGRASDTIIQYNDHPDTTKDDILALYDRAIAEAE